MNASTLALHLRLHLRHTRAALPPQQVVLPFFATPNGLAIASVRDHGSSHMFKAISIVAFAFVTMMTSACGQADAQQPKLEMHRVGRSEERRVGKEWRSEGTTEI